MNEVFIRAPEFCENSALAFCNFLSELAMTLHLHYEEQMMLAHKESELGSSLMENPSKVYEEDAPF